MSEPIQPEFKGGKNIAMKLPPHLFDQTVVFYKDVLKLALVEQTDDGVAVEFGSSILWLDRVEHISQPETWLEIVTEDIHAAADYFNRKGVVRRDEVERLPEEFEGFWIANPANVIHLVRQPSDSG